MLPQCLDQGVGVIPWSPLARGRLTRDWSETTPRTQTDDFALRMYRLAAEADKPVFDMVEAIARRHAVPRAHVALAWLLSRPAVTAPIIGATRADHLETALGALEFTLSAEEVAALEAPYLPHPVDGIVPPLPGEPPQLTLGQKL